MKNRFEIGQSFETQVVAITDTTVFLDLSAKSEGVLDRAEVVDENGKITIKEGDKIKVYYSGEVNGEMCFTTKISGGKADKAMLENAWKNQIPVEGHVEKEIKGGFEVKIGSSRAFCPYSQMGFRKKEEPSFYVGKHLTFIISEYKEDGRNLLVSNKMIGQSEYDSNLAKLASEITEGAIVEGVVESIEKFGAFVNISGFRALLPISELSFERVNDVSSVVQEGQKLTLKVLKTDWKNERVSVSLKALIKDPWDVVEEKFSVGSKIDGVVSRIADFGLFINLDKGIDGLLHISEIEGISGNSNLRKMFKVGQKMSVVIEKIDVAQKRISLKMASSNEQERSAENYISSQKDDGETYNPFAILLKK